VALGWQLREHSPEQATLQVAPVSQSTLPLGPNASSQLAPGSHSTLALSPAVKLQRLFSSHFVEQEAPQTPMQVVAGGQVNEHEPPSQAPLCQPASLPVSSKRNEPSQAIRPVTATNIARRWDARTRQRSCGRASLRRRRSARALSVN
jgi:hypothetical protein